jgi:hypothetical protein
MSDPPPGFELLITSIGPDGKSSAIAGAASMNAPAIISDANLVFMNVSQLP